MRRSVVSIALAWAATSTLVASLATVGPAGAAQTMRFASHGVELITGDWVAISHAAGHDNVAVVPRSRLGIAGQFSTLRLAGHTYVIPGAARRYLGTVLDRSLFDVTTLAKQSSNGRFAVSVGLVAGTKPVVPGLTVTSRSASTERGYLTAHGARAFGAALARQTAADSKARRSPVSLFGGVSRIAPAGVVAGHPVTPNFQQYTLQVKVIDPAGAPADFAFVILTNVDDGRKFGNFLPVLNGVAKVSVPVGTYSGIAIYDTFTPTSAKEYLVPREEFDVTTNNQSMVFDARTATVTPSVRTPRPAHVVSETLEWDRSTRRTGTGVDFGYDGSITVKVAPTGQVTKGRLDWITSWALASDPDTGAGYTYDLSFHDSGRVPANQRHSVATGQLARIDASYYTDGRKRDGYFGRGAVYPAIGGGWTTLSPLAMPLARTEYVYAPSTARFEETLIAAPTEEDPFQGFVINDRHYPSGAAFRMDWLRGPLAPGIQAQTPGQLYGCTACRDATNLLIAFAPYTDTTPGHWGSFDLLTEDQVASRFQLYRNGTLIDNQVNSGGDLVTVPTAASTYRALVTVHRKIAGFHTSTDTTEDVTFRSSATSGPTAPPGWFCPDDPPCTVLPILSATVPLPTDGESRLPVGATPVVFSVGYNQHAAASAIGVVTFAITTNGGVSYHTRPVTSLGHGKYRITLVNSASSVGHGVGIRITATDSRGGKLVETVQNAYLVTR